MVDRSFGDRLYTCTDTEQCGLFPTRGEPATNMPMVEMMACGKPVIASYCGGQTDVLRPDDNCRALTDLDREPASHDRSMKEDLGQWWSPCVEELVAQMEWCFENREEADQIGPRAALDLRSHMTWKHTARQFVQLAEKVTSPVEATACDSGLVSTLTVFMLNVRTTDSMMAGGMRISRSQAIQRGNPFGQVPDAA